VQLIFKSQRLSQMNKIGLYINESFDELMHKVSWPTLNELQSNTTIVVVAMVVIALVVLLMDYVSNFTIVEMMYNNILKTS
jgi:preprotein translocase subunit SecE